MPASTPVLKLDGRIEMDDAYLGGEKSSGKTGRGSPGKKPIVAAGATVLTDGLACFRGLADAGCVHVPVVAGSGRKAARHPAFKWVSTMIGNMKSAITGTYRALRKKHMARYLAEFEWRFNHRFDLAATIPALGRAAVTTKPAFYWRLKMS